MTRPNYIIWGEGDDYRLADTLILALEAKNSYGGCIYEPLGSVEARQVVKYATPDVDADLVSCRPVLKADRSTWELYQYAKSKEAEVARMEIAIRRWTAPTGVHRSCSCFLCEELRALVEP